MKNLTLIIPAIKAQRSMMPMASSSSYERKRIDGQKKVNAFNLKMV